MNKVPKIILAIILSLVLLLAGCSAGSEPLTPSMARVGEPAPDFKLENLDGQSVSLSDLRGKPILLNFWATWCPPCRAEMPFLQQIYEEWSDKGLVLLAIDIGEGPSQIKEFLEANNLSLPVLLDSNKSVAQKYNITAIPTTFFIDKDGIIQVKIIGAFPSKGAIEKNLNKIMP